MTKWTPQGTFQLKPGHCDNCGKPHAGESEARPTICDDCFVAMVSDVLDAFAPTMERDAAGEVIMPTADQLAAAFVIWQASEPLHQMMCIYSGKRHHKRQALRLLCTHPSGIDLQCPSCEFSRTIHPDDTIARMMWGFALGRCRFSISSLFTTDAVSQ